MVVSIWTQKLEAKKNPPAPSALAGSSLLITSKQQVPKQLELQRLEQRLEQQRQQLEQRLERQRQRLERLEQQQERLLEQLLELG